MSMVPIIIKGMVFRPGGRTVLDELSASITPSGVTAVIGPNGAGKSVMLRMIDGVLRPDAGSIRFGDRLPQDVRRAFVFQKPGLIRGTVAQNVALALAPLRLSRSTVSTRVEAALNRVGLGNRARDAARKLSGGEQQRLALARALIVEPELLLLDEPTANLDPGATEAIEEIIAATAQAGTKVLLVSHHLGQVARLATVDPTGRPHVVPICFAMEGDTLYTAVDEKPKRTRRLRRLENIEANPAVEVLIDHYDEDWTRLRWVRLRGAARIVEGRHAVELLAGKYPQYREQPPPGPVIRIEVRRWVGWSARPR